jgi:hypothetical protein
MMLALEQTTYLGPARVLRAAGGRVQLELPDEVAWAAVAVAFPYQVVEGDAVLAIGRSGAWYVIGVLNGCGPTTLVVPGNLSIQAPHGRIELTAMGGIDLTSPTVTVTAGRLELMAKSAIERFGRAARWVRGAFQLRAGRWRTHVDGRYGLKAQRIVARAVGAVKIDGDQIHLG